MNVIQMSRLGNYGRWGNQLCQYGVLWTMAQEAGCEFQAPPWLGTYLFDAPHIPVSHKLPHYQEQYDKAENPLVPRPEELVGRDYWGYCQYHTSWWTPERRKVWKDIYVPTTDWYRRMLPAYLTFQDAGKTHIGIHIRRGDYGQGTCYDAITPVQWYLDWLKEHWKQLDNPTMFIATEDVALIQEFAEYQPHTVASLDITLRPEPYPYFVYLATDLKTKQPHLMDFLPEWLMLRECEILLTANSTFSFTAAMASTRNVQLWRPSVPEQRFTEEAVWNCWPLRKDSRVKK